MRRRRPGRQEDCRCKAVIINGLGLEGWLPRLVQSAGSKAVIVAAIRWVSRRSK